MAKKIDIAGTLNAATTDGVLGFSEQIKDESKGKMQSSLNKEFGEGIDRIERKSDIAYNAVKTLEGLSNANEAMQTLAGQVVQIEENKQNIASNKADADAKLSELGSKRIDVLPIPLVKVPSNEYGNDGDFVLIFIADNNNRVYKKTNGVWSIWNDYQNLIATCGNRIFYKANSENTTLFEERTETIVDSKLSNDISQITQSTGIEGQYYVYQNDRNTQRFVYYYSLGVWNVIASTNLYKNIRFKIDGLLYSFNKDKGIVEYSFSEKIKEVEKKVNLSAEAINNKGFKELSNSEYTLLEHTFTEQSIDVTIPIQFINGQEYTLYYNVEQSNKSLTLVTSNNGANVTQIYSGNSQEEGKIQFKATADANQLKCYTQSGNTSVRLVVDEDSFVTQELKNLNLSIDAIKYYPIVYNIQPSSSDHSFTKLKLSITGEEKEYVKVENLTNSGSLRIDINPSECGGVIGTRMNVVAVIYSDNSMLVKKQLYKGGYIIDEALLLKKGFNKISVPIEVTESNISNTHYLYIGKIANTSFYFSEVIAYNGEYHLTNYFSNVTLQELNDKIEENVYKKDWSNKILCTYGDSVTALQGGDFDIPINETSHRWGNRVANYLDMKKHYGRGIGGQRYAWLNGGGAITWVYKKTGIMYNRNDAFNLDNWDGVSFPSNWSDSQKQVVLNGLADGSIVSIRGCSCSWLRITSMIPSSIKDTIDVIYVMYHNDSVDGKEFAWIEGDTTDPEWAASSYYSTYGGDYNISTLEGGIASTIMKLQAWMPNAIIILGTPINGQNPTAGVLRPDANGLYKQVQHVKNVGLRFSIPVIDVYATCGINGLNRTSYITDTIHPYSVEGSKMIARAIIGGMKSILPKLE